MGLLPEIHDETALARLFRKEAVQKEVAWFCLPGGQKLYAAGDPADQFFLLRSGRLGAFRSDNGHEP